MFGKNQTYTLNTKIVNRKLGILNDELEPVEAALQEFMAMFNGPLPTEVITALTTLSNLEDNATGEMDDALINLIADGGAKLHFS